MQLPELTLRHMDYTVKGISKQTRLPSLLNIDQNTPTDAVPWNVMLTTGTFGTKFRDQRAGTSGTA